MARQVAEQGALQRRQPDNFILMVNVTEQMKECVILFWELAHGHRGRGPATPYINRLMADTVPLVSEMKLAMMDHGR